MKERWGLWGVHLSGMETGIQATHQWPRLRAYKCLQFVPVPSGGMTRVTQHRSHVS